MSDIVTPENHQASRCSLNPLPTRLRPPHTRQPSLTPTTTPRPKTANFYTHKPTHDHRAAAAGPVAPDALGPEPFAQYGLYALCSCYAYSQRLPGGDACFGQSTHPDDTIQWGPRNDTPDRRSTAGSCSGSGRVDRILLELASTEPSVVAITVGRDTVC